MGGTATDITKSNPSGEHGWLENRKWALIEEVSKTLEHFYGLDADFEK